MKKLEINLGSACNNQCKFCMVDDEQRDRACFVNFSKVKNELLNGRKRGFDSIGFLGGEVTLHPQILKIFHASKLLNYNVIHLITNGRRLASKEFANDVIRTGVNRFSFSIHSHDEKIEDSLTQVNGSFKEKVIGLKNVLTYQNKFKFPLSINLVINKDNYQSLDKTMEYFARLGVKNFHFNYMWICGRAFEYPEIHLDYNSFMKFFEKLIKHADQLKVDLTFEGIPPCYVDKNYWGYLSEFRDNLTEVISYLENPDKSDSFNWSERKESEHKFKTEECKTCEIEKFCEGFWKTNYSIDKNSKK